MLAKSDGQLQMASLLLCVRKHVEIWPLLRFIIWNATNGLLENVFVSLCRPEVVLPFAILRYDGITRLWPVSCAFAPHLTVKKSDKNLIVFIEIQFGGLYCVRILWRRVFIVIFYDDSSLRFPLCSSVQKPIYQILLAADYSVARIRRLVVNFSFARSNRIQRAFCRESGGRSSDAERK